MIKSSKKVALKHPEAYDIGRRRSLTCDWLFLPFFYLSPSFNSVLSSLHYSRVSVLVVGGESEQLATVMRGTNGLVGLNHRIGLTALTSFSFQNNT